MNIEIWQQSYRRTSSLRLHCYINVLFFIIDGCTESNCNELLFVPPEVWDRSRCRGMSVFCCSLTFTSMTKSASQVDKAIFSRQRVVRAKRLYKISLLHHGANFSLVNGVRLGVRLTGHARSYLSIFGNYQKNQPGLVGEVTSFKDQEKRMIPN